MGDDGAGELMTTKEFLIVQAAIIVLFLATFEAIVSGPMEEIKRQQATILWLNLQAYNDGKRGSMALELIERSRLFDCQIKEDKF